MGQIIATYWQFLVKIVLLVVGGKLDNIISNGDENGTDRCLKSLF